MIKLSSLLDLSEYSYIQYSYVENLYDDLFEYNEDLADGLLSLFVDIDSTNENYETVLKILYALCIKNESNELDYSILLDYYNDTELSIETLYSLLEKYDYMVESEKRSTYVKLYNTQPIITSSGTYKSPNLMYFLNTSDEIITDKAYYKPPYNLILVPKFSLIRTSNADGFKNYYEVKRLVKASISSSYLFTGNTYTSSSSIYYKFFNYIKYLYNNSLLNYNFVEDLNSKTEFSSVPFENTNYKRIFSIKYDNNNTYSIFDNRTTYDELISTINAFIDYQIENNMSESSTDIHANLKKYYSYLLDITTDEDMFNNYKKLISVSFLLEKLFGGTELTELTTACKATIPDINSLVQKIYDEYPTKFTIKEVY